MYAISDSVLHKYKKPRAKSLTCNHLRAAAILTKVASASNEPFSIKIYKENGKSVML